MVPLRRPCKWMEGSEWMPGEWETSDKQVSKSESARISKFRSRQWRRILECPALLFGHVPDSELRVHEVIERGS